MEKQKRFRFLIGLLIILACNLSLNAQDYSGYHLANKYLKEKKYLLAYKHLLIFKYTNLNYLQKPSNSETLTKLDANIAEFESTLQDNVSWYKIKEGRGFSDKETDKYLKETNAKLKIDSLQIQ